MCAGILLGTLTALNGSLHVRTQDLIRSSGVESAAVAVQDLQTGHRLFLNAESPFHAASTIKLAVMVAAYRLADSRTLSLDESLPIRNAFRSIADGSIFSLIPDDDADPELYTRLGKSVSVRELIRRMIVSSSNLATNLLVEKLGTGQIMAALEQIGADGLKVLRGVEDSRAYAKGLNNSATARALLRLLSAIAQPQDISQKAAGEMQKVLLDQKFNEGIPAGVPPGWRCAHKTGWTDEVYHDAAIVYPESGRPYLLVVLTQGKGMSSEQHRLVRDVSRLVAEEVSRVRGRRSRS